MDRRPMTTGQAWSGPSAAATDRWSVRGNGHIFYLPLQHRIQVPGLSQRRLRSTFDYSTVIGSDSSAVGDTARTFHAPCANCQ